MCELTWRQFLSHGRRVLVVCAAVAIYLWLYDECVRMPFVAFTWKVRPYYALGRRLRPGIDQASMGWGEVRLPDAPAKWFFGPAHWLDCRLHPGLWPELPPDPQP